MGQFNWRVGNVSRQSNIVKIELSTLKLYNEKNHTRQIVSRPIISTRLNSTRFPEFESLENFELKTDVDSFLQLWINLRMNQHRIHSYNCG